jgi:NAD+ diphosphatase
MPFIPSVTRPSAQTEPAWWFVFQESKLLVKTDHESVAVPCEPGTDPFSLSHSLCRQYLGLLDGCHCYAADSENSVQPPAGMSFQGLRSLFGMLDEELYKTASFALQIINWDKISRYCGQCGAPLRDKQGERAKICPKCGLIHYPRISPAVIVSVIKDNRILLAHSARFPSSKLYSVLAGYVELGESLEETIIREVREEVGIEVKNIRYFGSQPWPYSNSLMVAFTAEYAGGEISADNYEITDAGWFTADNLPSLPGWGSIARNLIDSFVRQMT